MTKGCEEMLDIFKSFFETLSRIGKYYGVEKTDSESEMAALSYTEKKRVLSNLRRTLIFIIFMIYFFRLFFSGTITSFFLFTFLAFISSFNHRSCAT